MLHQLRRDRGLFDDRAVRCEIAAQNGDAALRPKRLLERIDDPLRSVPARAIRRIGAQRPHLTQLLADRPARHRPLVQVQQAAAGQLLHHRWHTARVEQLLHVKEPAGTQVGNERRLARQSVEQLQGQLDAAPAGDGHQVDDRVGRPTEGHHQPDRIFKCPRSQDVAGSDGLFARLDYLAAGRLGQP